MSRTTLTLRHQDLEQLAGFTGRSIEPTRSLLNALGLIGVLEVVAR